MSSGKTHEKINILAYLIIAWLVLSGFIYINFGVKYGLWVVSVSIGYVVGTYWLNPDLDIKSRPYYRWKLLRWIWIPYQAIFKHRSIWTHGIIIGDIIRFLYLGAIIWGVLYAVNVNINQLKITDEKVLMLFLMFFIGNVFSSIAHILTDHTSTGLKRLLK